MLLATFFTNKKNVQYYYDIINKITKIGYDLSY